jgi:hypothetical protein
MSEYQGAYAAVIADLKRRRDEIDAMIAQLEAIAGGGAVTTSTPSGSADRPAKAETGERSHSDFLGMSIADAAKILLGKRRKPLSPFDIVAGLEAGGLILSSGNKSNVVGSVLNRRQKQVGDIVSPKRGMWALKEWYPNRNFGKKGGEQAPSEREEGAVADDSLSETSETEQPFEQLRIVPLRSSD